MAEEKKKAKINYPAIKIGAAAILVVALSGFLGYALSQVQGFSDLKGVIVLAAAFIFWLALVSLLPFIIENKALGAALAFFQAWLVWYFLLDPLNAWSILGGLVLFLFLVISFVSGRRELNNCLKIRFFKINRSATSPAITGLALVLTLLFASSIAFPGINLSKPAFEFFLFGSDSVFENISPGFKMKARVDSVLKETARKELPRGASENEIELAAEGLREEFERSFGIKIAPDERVIDALYDISISYINNLSDDLKVLVSLALLLIVFSLAKFAGHILGWLINVLAFLAFQLLIGFNFLKLSIEQANKETINLN